MHDGSAMQWGADPEFYGPRHLARLSLIMGLLAPRLAPGARVLDVGAGAGRLVAALAARGYRAVGVEPSADFVAHATARAPAGARFVAGSAEALPFEDASFEAVVAGEVLEHLADDAVAVRELARVLVPGGVCVASVPADPARWDASDDWAGHKRRYRPAELRQLFETAGFAVERLVGWGFPLGALYHHWLFLPLLARKRAAGGAPARPPGAARRLAYRLAAAVFAFDRLFARSARAPGLVIVARKRGGV